MGSLYEFDYANIAQFAERALRVIFAERPKAKIATITLHGPGYGLDELASIDSLVKGIRAVEAIAPAGFVVRIVERNQQRVARLREYLDAAASAPASTGAIGAATPTATSDISNQGTYSKRLFAAIPFATKFLDHWQFALEPAAHANQLVIERLDHEQFTGDILAEIRARIERANAVVAVLDGNNPNVFLEVGYAWGVGRPTILALDSQLDPPFDVKGHKMIRYSRIGELHELLTKELKGLLAKAAI